MNLATEVATKSIDGNYEQSIYWEESLSAKKGFLQRFTPGVEVERENVVYRHKSRLLKLADFLQEEGYQNEVKKFPLLKVLEVRLCQLGEVMRASPATW